MIGIYKKKSVQLTKYCGIIYYTYKSYGRQHHEFSDCTYY